MRALGELRRARGVTQQQLGEAIDRSQRQVSRAERADDQGDLQVASLRRYIEGLGGRLEVVAVFPDGERFTLVDAEHRRGRPGRGGRGGSGSI